MLELFFELPEADGFVLAGGAALVASGLTERPTQDVDLFDARRALERAVGPYAGPDGVRIPGSHWLVEAAVAGDACGPDEEPRVAVASTRALLGRPRG